MRKIALAISLLLSCNKSESAKDKEIAELRTKLSEKSAPSLGSVTNASQPELARTKHPETELNTAPPPESDSKRAVRIIGERLLRATTNDDALLDLVRDANSPESKKITYAHLKKNALKYTGMPYKLTGHILEIEEKNGIDYARIAINWYGDAAIFVKTTGTSDFVLGDWVDVVGFLAGNYSYTSQAGWEISIPSMIAVPFRKQGSLSKMMARAKVGSGK